MCVSESVCVRERAQVRVSRERRVRGRVCEGGHDSKCVCVMILCESVCVRESGVRERESRAVCERERVFERELVYESV